MNVIRRRGWEIPESQLTPEHLVFNRRNLLIGGAKGGGVGRAREMHEFQSSVRRIASPSAAA